jgi:hypothetical protein
VRERVLLDENAAINAATARGMKQRIEIGIEKGKLEAEAAILARLLTKRFGPLSPQVQAKLYNATLEQLNTWADRILDAPTLDALFAAH